MNISKNKKIQTAISMILILSMIASIAYVSADVVNVNGKTLVINRIHTWLYVGTSAGGGGIADVGVGQKMMITAWTKDMPPDVGETANLITAPNGRAGWYGVTVTITKPDNTSETLPMGYSDPVGNNYMTYTPDQVGTYYIQAHFPETWKNSTNPTESHEAGYPNLAATLYSAADSRVDEFQVTSEPVPSFPESPLPNDYWTRPITSASRDWYVLTANKLGGASGVWPVGSSGGNVGNFYYGSGPMSPHILWSKPYSVGGLMDQRDGTTTFETTHYQGTSFSATIIMDGKLYWSPRYTTHQNQGLEVIDLYTGETIYKNYTDSNYNFASIYNYNSPNQMGGFDYLWRQAGSNVGTGGLVTLQSTAFSIPQVIQLANATETANCEMIRLGNDYSVNTSITPVALGTVWQMVDGWTQNPITLIANVTQTTRNLAGQTVTTGATGTNIYGQDGSILYYNIVNLGTPSNPQNYLQVWNSSAGTMVASQDGTGYWQWRPAGGQFGASDNYFATSGAIPNIVHNGAVFFSQNFTIPSLMGPTPSYENATIRCIRQDDYMIVGTQGWNDGTTVIKGWMEGIGLNASNRGQKLWEMTYTPPFADPALNVSKPAMFSGGMGLAGVYPEDNVLVWTDPQNCQRWVYDLTSGQLLWTSPQEAQYEYYGTSQVVYNHMLLGYGSYTGQIIAYDIRTGTQLWNYTSINQGFESPYGNYPMTIDAVCNGMIYTTTSEHHNIQPMYRGENLRCLNATTGQEIWKILAFGRGISIADGILIHGDNFDNMIYAYGKGPSATTVTSSQDIAILGGKVMIKGTVTDQTTSGRHNTNGDVDFTLQGTPAVSDASMSQWMEYKFKQQAKPTNTTGVPVELTAIDPNGNFLTLGTATSDMNGNYVLPYTPEVPGMYQVFANFKGTNSYGPSSATTYIDVSDAAVAPTVAPTSVAVSVADQYFIPAIAGLFVLIIIVLVVVVLLMLRKK